MKTLAFAALFALTAVSAQSPKIGQSAPNFAVKTMAGKATNESVLTKTGPVVLIFVDVNCPVTAGLFKYYDQVFQSLSPKKVAVYAVLNASASRAKEYAREHKTKVAMLLDPSLKSFHQFGLVSSPASVVLGKGGKIVRLDKGCSEATLKGTLTAAAQAKGITAPVVVFKGAPTRLTFG